MLNEFLLSNRVINIFKHAGQNTYSWEMYGSFHVSTQNTLTVSSAEG